MQQDDVNSEFSHSAELSKGLCVTQPSLLPITAAAEGAYRPLF